LFAACNNSDENKKTIPVAELPTIKLMQDLIQKYPDSLILKENLIQNYRDSAEYNKAIELTSTYLKSDSLNTKLWRIKGTLAAENDDTLLSINCFENIINIQPAGNDLVWLGILYASTKNPNANVIEDSLLVHNKENYGCYYSRNLGLKFMESGEYDFFTVQDADDFSQPERFEKIISVFENNSNLICVYNYYLRFGKEAPEWHSKTFEPTPDLAHAFFTKYVFEKLGYFDNMKFNSDQEYFERTRALCHINPSYINLIPDVLYYSELTGKNLILKYGIEERNVYKKKWISEIKKMEIEKNFYRSFFEPKEIIKWVPGYSFL
jgi:tetratricopeptide (TPR) repeat protein